MNGRTLLLLHALWDAVGIVLGYNLIYAFTIEGIEKTNGAVTMVFCWLTASYITGRYSMKRIGSSGRKVKRIGSLVAVCIFVLGVFIGHSWLYGIVSAEARLKEFLLPVLLVSSGIAAVGDIVAEGIARRKDENWYILVNDRERGVLNMEVEEESLRQLNVRFFECVDDYIYCLAKSDVTKDSFAVGKEFIEDEELVRKLILYRKSGGTVMGIVDWCENELQRTPPELVDEGWFIASDGFNLRAGSLGWRTKRIGDVLGATILAVIAVPIVVIAVICVLIEDGRPVLYKQKRTGLYEKEITIWKIRSMKKDAEEDGAQWSRKGDSRVTAVGKIIRRLRIDELPQLLSVMVGELSLIGPRPERAEIEERLVKYIDHYRVRHWVKPGLSGWAQVSYPYGASIEDSRKKLSYDIYYVRNAGVLLDLLVIVKTIRLVLSGRGSIAIERR